MVLKKNPLWFLEISAGVGGEKLRDTYTKLSLVLPIHVGCKDEQLMDTPGGGISSVAVAAKWSLFPRPSVECEEGQAVEGSCLRHTNSVAFYSVAAKSSRDPQCGFRYKVRRDV